jgi:hypothetical protein
VLHVSYVSSKIESACRTSFRHIHRHKAASRDRQEMAETCLSLAPSSGCFLNRFRKRFFNTPFRFN